MGEYSENKHVTGVAVNRNVFSVLIGNERLKFLTEGIFPQRKRGWWAIVRIFTAASRPNVVILKALGSKAALAKNIFTCEENIRYPE